MIPQKQIKEIRKYLYTSENPMFFYDDDPDGLTSYILLRRYCDKGRGVMIKSAKQELDVEFLKPIRNYSPDKVFILDKPIVSQEFIDGIHVPVIWIDHHEPLKRKGVHYYNPHLTQKEDIPVSRICYEIVKQDLWISMVGCISDHHIPDFAKEFSEQYPNLFDIKIKNPGKAIFETGVGKLAMVFDFVMKGKATDVKKYLSALTRVNSPYEILNQETTTGSYIYKKYKKINKEYQLIIKDALSKINKDPLFIYIYSQKKLAFSGLLSNEILYKFPNKITIIAREKEKRYTLSFRSKKYVLPELLQKAMSGLEGYCGGHPHACGGSISKEDFQEFISRLKKELKWK